MTNQEMQNLKNEFMNGNWNTDEEVRRGIAKYVKAVEAAARNIDASTPKEVKEQYLSSGYGRDFSKELGAASFEFGKSPPKMKIEDIERRILEMEARK